MHQPSSRTTGRTSPTSGASLMLLPTHDVSPPLSAADGHHGHSSEDGTVGTLVKEQTPPVLIGAPPPSGPEGSPVRTSPSPESARGSRESEASSPSLSLSLWSGSDLPSSSSKMFRASSPAMEGETWRHSSVRFANSGTASLGGLSTQRTSECPSADEGSSSSRCDAVRTTLTDVLQPSAARRFFLSARAASGILRRAEKRGRPLPTGLMTALTSLASSGQSPEASPMDPTSESRTRPSSPRRSEHSTTSGTTVGQPTPSPSHRATSSLLVRRLTPLECERLMGWPDGHTIVPGWKSAGSRRTSAAKSG